jgi:N-acetylglucosaminyldiphosphoundecaprenol N-acetyl-beta-D-mannosaminyltransferase
MPSIDSFGEGFMDNRVWVWGIPLAPLTLSQAVEAVVNLVEVGEPSFFITANTHYAMLTKDTPDLKVINVQAAFVLADGAPLVWASRWKKSPLPERVAGSDLIFELCAAAARGGHRVFLLGGAEGVADEAAKALIRRYPGLRIVGTEAPPFRALSADEDAALRDRIRAARPDLLFVAFGQPKGEFWIARHFRSLGIPVCVQVGASFDFIAGRVRRAPRRLQKIGLEWAYRMYLEPSRLAPRYARNAWFLLSMVTHDLVQAVGERVSRSRSLTPLPRQPDRGY